MVSKNSFECVLRFLYPHCNKNDLIGEKKEKQFHHYSVLLKYSANNFKIIIHFNLPQSVSSREKGGSNPPKIKIRFY